MGVFTRVLTYTVIDFSTCDDANDNKNRFFFSGLALERSRKESKQEKAAELAA